MSGAIFETFVINEILKSYSNEEIDLIIHENGILYPIEIKMTTKPQAIMASEFEVLDDVPDKKRGMGAII